MNNLTVRVSRGSWGYIGRTMGASNFKSSQAKSRLQIVQQHLVPNRLGSSVGSSVGSCVSDESQGFGSVSVGSKYTSGYRKYATDKIDGKLVSYFHDIPMDLDVGAKTVNMVVEIPRWTNAKFEIDTLVVGNPITQDEKKGQVRFVKNLFPHHGYIHNYGAIPRTWEDPTTKNEEVDLFGDNDPLDVCEIGARQLGTGDVVRVKVLGSLALIDDGELDWKVIVIRVDDELAAELNDIHDVFEKCPSLLETTRQWFTDYKLPDGKPKNKFAFNGAYKDQKHTLKVLQECHNSWRKLVLGQVSGQGLPDITNVTIPDSPGYIAEFDKSKVMETGPQADSPIPQEVHKVYFASK